MGSSQPGPNDDSDRDEQDVLAAISDLTRAWESSPQVVSSVRRPSTLPEPQSYHEVIEPRAIFELDEKQQDASIKTILVVPFGCQRCKLLRQACSRTRPACVRCRKAGLSCRVVQEGYQRLPGPKVAKSSTTGKKSAKETRENSEVSYLPEEPTAGRSRTRRKASGVASLSQAPLSNSGSSTASASKRPPSPASDSVRPRKKTRVKTTSGSKKARPRTVVASEEMDIQHSGVSAVDPSAEVMLEVDSTLECGALNWTFVRNNSRGRDNISSPGQKHVNSMPSNSPIPRVWTNSLDGLLTVFPELAKTPVGFSWFQSETPILLLDTNYSQGHWINSTTLGLDLLWDFSCYDFELESMVESDTGVSTQLHSGQPMVDSPENTLGCEVDTMGSRYSYLPPKAELYPPCAAASTSLATSSAQIPPDGDTPQYEGYTCQGTCMYHTRGSSHDGTLSDYPLSPPENPPFHPCPEFNGSPTYHMPFQSNSQTPIPLNKPPAVEILKNCHLRFIPLLLWTQHDSGLVPCSLPSEYAYLCMGLFFISDLHHVVVQHGISSTTGVIEGRICWRVTLQWAPGGEDALNDYNPVPSSGMTLGSAPLDITRHLLHPWWLDATDISQTDYSNAYRPRDLRMQFFSFIPLDLLADFHPSETFPRGWFCKSCGMINTQKLFRHQICQSTMCGSTREGHASKGKADPLSSLRGPYQSSILIRPTDGIPSFVVSDCITWDDGMQSWLYRARDGVTLCHIFTGNQEHLQDDANALLESIQRDVLLRKDDTSGPYFTHTTRLSHPSDGSETMVPKCTPVCVRVAYYTLCDFVHRYGEMAKPRFSEVRMLAWVNSGSRRGSMLRASKSPVVIHCLGAEVGLNFSPKGGYNDSAQSIASEKGKGRAKNEDQTGSPPIEPLAGPSRCEEQDIGNQPSLIPGSEEIRSPILAEHVDEATTSIDIMHHYYGLDAGGVAVPDSNTSNFGSGTEVARHEVTEPKQGRDRKKNKVTKDKNKASVPEISMTLVHGDCVVLHGDNFECKVVRTGTSILVIGFPEET